MMQLHAMVSALTAACLLSGRGSSVAAFTAAANGCFDDNPGLQEAIGEAGATCAYALKQNYCVTNTALSKKYCPATCDMCAVGTPPPTVPPPAGAAEVYTCDAAAGQCRVAPVVAPGAASLEVCSQTCGGGGQPAAPPPPSAASCSACADINLWGNDAHDPRWPFTTGCDLHSRPGTSAQCCGFCTALAQCTGFTWDSDNGGVCYLKVVANCILKPQNPGQALVSAVLPSRGGSCTPSATVPPTPPPTPKYECYGSQCEGDSCPSAGSGGTLVCTGGSRCCGEDSMFPSCIAPNSGKKCCTHFMAATQCDAADACCGSLGPGASSSASCCKAPTGFCCGGYNTNSYGSCCKTNQCNPTGGCGGIGAQ